MTQGRATWGITGLPERVRSVVGERGRVSHTSAYLMLSTVGSGMVGIIFWAVAAHLFSTGEVGVGSAEVSAMGLLAGFAQLNLSNAYVRFLPVAGARTSKAILQGYALCLSTAGAVAVIFIGISGARAIAFDSWQADAAFALSVLLWTVFALQDGVLTGLHRAAVVPAENIGYAVAKLLLLPVFAFTAPGHGIFFAWMLPVIPTVALVSGYVVRSLRRFQVEVTGSDTSAIPSGSELRSFLGAEYVHSLVTSAAAFLLPVVIEAQRGSEAEAHFYVPWLVYMSFAGLLANVSAGLVLDMARGDRMVASARRGLAIMAGIAILAVVVCVALAKPVLELFSVSYGTSGAISVLRLVGASVPLNVLAMLLGSYLWIQRRIWSLAGMRFLQAIVLIGGSELLLGPLGIAGAGVALLLSSASLAAVALPVLVRWYRRTFRAREQVMSA